ncbi:putative ABC transport system ATP-binding protein [Desulfomicrobium apsheronum]|uniref:Putative ABC transport system ATP-binding protein n=1 Tax=Desulfomicrobium apsheronum TaxID=52560 RepID=A0A1I3QI82_9BACT|nr:ATP-binding cassette domain-containing protein [Desulfomicrobium apsheronum]SFJ33435.1 putative ABC transport system ATP-binding protein [Desulfomicrobium apsheronum]
MIRVQAINKYFHRGSVNEVHSLRDLSIDIEQGDFITIIGSNGAGKSTFLSCLAGTHALDSGNITMAGTDVTRWPEHKRARFIGRVFQDPLMGTCASGSIAQNMALAQKRGQRRGLSRGVKTGDREAFRQHLRVLGLGLEDRLQDRAGLLSGGQRQALTMVMATLVRPELLLLDEHTAALDPKTAGQILELTRNIVTEHGLTTLMVTHNMHQALALGNRLIMMHRGRIIFDVRGQEKEELTVEVLLDKFQSQADAEVSDRMLLG